MVNFGYLSTYQWVTTGFILLRQGTMVSSHEYSMHKQYGVYLESQWNPGPSDPEADDIPMCHHASQRPQ